MVLVVSGLGCGVVGLLLATVTTVLVMRKYYQQQEGRVPQELPPTTRSAITEDPTVSLVYKHFPENIVKTQP